MKPFFRPLAAALLCAASLASEALFAQVGAYPSRPVKPIICVGLIPNVLEVSAKSRFKTAQELIAEASSIRRTS